MTSPSDGFLSAGETGGTEARTPDVVGGLYFVDADGKPIEPVQLMLDDSIHFTDDAGESLGGVAFGEEGLVFTDAEGSVIGGAEQGRDGWVFFDADGRAVEGDAYALDFGILAIASEADHVDLV